LLLFVIDVRVWSDGSFLLVVVCAWQFALMMMSNGLGRLITWLGMHAMDNDD